MWVRHTSNTNATPAIAPVHEDVAAVTRIAKAVRTMMLMALLVGCADNPDITGALVLSPVIIAGGIVAAPVYGACRLAGGCKSRAKVEQYPDEQLANCDDDQAARHQFVAGWDYVYGRGVEKDIRRAVFWFGVSAKNAYPAADQRYQEFARQLSPEELDKVKQAIAKWKPDSSECEAGRKATMKEGVAPQPSTTERGQTRS